MNRFVPMILTLAMTFVASAQSGDPKATGSVWLDAFGGPKGAVIYPQYTWSIPTSIGSFGGYGFLESAPHELLFSNNLIGFTPAVTPWFTVHSEVGGLPGKQLGFVQLGPRVNFHKAIPGVHKAMAFAWAAYCPELVGIRTKNVVVAGASQAFPVIGRRLTAHIEAFDRIFANGSYGEMWLVMQPRGLNRFEPVAHVIRDTGRYVVSAGLRIKLL
jgi:hypothetical protein